MRRRLFDEYHGGACCGIKHIFNFDEVINLSKDDIKKHIMMTIERANRTAEFDEDIHDLDDDACFLYEVVLTFKQLAENPALTIALTELGFKEVNKFKNVNTNNVCHIFHRAVTDDHYDTDLE